MNPVAVAALTNGVHNELHELRAYVRGIVSLAAAAKEGPVDIEAFGLSMLLSPIEEKVSSCISLLELAERAAKPSQQPTTPNLKPC